MALMKDFGVAEASYKKAAELAPKSTAPYVSLAELYRVQGKMDQAIKEYEEVVAKNPKLVSMQFLLGLIYEQQKNPGKAKALYQSVLKADPKFAPAANNLAYMLAEEGEDLDQALTFAQSAREQVPDDPNIADTLGWVYYKKKAYLKASELLKEAVDKLRDSPVVQYHYGMAQYMNGDRDGAKKSLQAALKLTDKFPGADEAKRALEGLKES